LSRYFWIAALVVAVGSSPATAAVRSVPQDYSSIQAGVLAAEKGDVVEVGPGAYAEIILMKPGITLRSTHGPDSTRIESPGLADPATAERVIECKGPEFDRSTVIEGFFFDAMVYSGTGVYCDGASPTIRGNRFLGFGWGLQLLESDALVVDNVFDSCTTFGILARASSAEIYSNTFRDCLRYGIAVSGKKSHPKIGGSAERANHFVSNEFAIRNGTRNDLDATYNDWGWVTTDEMNAKGYPADILTIFDGRDEAKGRAEFGVVDYRNWIQPEQSGGAAAGSIPSGRTLLPIAGAVVLVLLVVGLSRRRARE
jgi:hypothetical protein